MKVESLGRGQAGRPRLQLCKAGMCDQTSACIPLQLAGCGQDWARALRRGCGPSVRGDGKGLPPAQSSREGGAKFSWRLGEEGLLGPVEVTRARWCRYLNWGAGGRCGFGCWGSPGSDMNESRAGHCEPADHQGPGFADSLRGGHPEDITVPGTGASLRDTGHSSRGLSWRVTLLQGRSLSENRSFRFQICASPTPCR